MGLVLAHAEGADDQNVQFLQQGAESGDGADVGEEAAAPRPFTTIRQPRMSQAAVLSRNGCQTTAPTAKAPRPGAS
jgi:hypothetical protein